MWSSALSVMFCADTVSFVIESIRVRHFSLSTDQLEIFLAPHKHIYHIISFQVLDWIQYFLLSKRPDMSVIINLCGNKVPINNSKKVDKPEYADFFDYFEQASR